MKVENYLENLIDDIKGNIECDSDILALDKLIRLMTKVDYERAQAIWKEIVNSEDFLNYAYDIDYTPLFDSCLVSFLEYQTFDNIIYFVSKLKLRNKNRAYHYIYNTFRMSSFINQYIKSIVLKNNKKIEKKTIDMFNGRSYFYPKEVFDMAKLLENVINWHIENNNIDLKLLNYFAELPTNRKDKAKLKTMLIDYNFKAHKTEINKELEKKKKMEHENRFSRRKHHYF